MELVQHHSKMIARFLLLMFLCFGRDASSFSTCDKPLDVLFAVDASGSIDDVQFKHSQKFLRDLVGFFRISNSAARMAVFGFDHLPRFSKASNLDDPTTVSLTGVREQIDDLNFSQGATLIHVGLVEAGNIFNSSTLRPNVSRVVVFLTDGVNYRGSDSLVQPAQYLRTIHNARVISIGIGSEKIVDEEALNIMVGPRMSDQIVLIDFKKKSCGADDDESENEDTTSGEESGNESEDDGCGTKLRAVASLICQ